MNSSASGVDLYFRIRLHFVIYGSFLFIHRLSGDWLILSKMPCEQLISRRRNQGSDIFNVQYLLLNAAVTCHTDRMFFAQQTHIFTFHMVQIKKTLNDV